jgi:hypothetical protein
MSDRLLDRVTALRTTPLLPMLAAAMLGSCVLGGCEDRTMLTPPDAQLGPDASERDAGPLAFSDSAIARTDLSIERVVPDHGPFIGGNRVILRGSGFTGDSQVYFGDSMVQPADHELIDSRRLAVIVPAGAPGVVDVRVEVGDETATAPARAEEEGAYTYDALYVDPSRGATAGGTFVTIEGSGTSFEAGDTVVFGRTECTDVQIVSPMQITCRTPPASAGFVDVEVHSVGGGDPIVGVDAYQYYDTSDPFSGGLGGGPIAGAINLTVINSGTGEPVEGAFAILGQDLSTEHQGLTNALGQITFSGADLAGQQTIHVSKFCFERTSFVSFDATDVTVFLVPWQDPMCGMGMGEIPPSRGRNGSFIEGHLVWPTDMARMRWDNVPEEREGWERVAYVYTTVYEIGFANPDPAAGGGIQRVTEESLDANGFPFRIFARPAGLAVYALAGLEETGTGRFAPYVMGVARNVLAGPGETVRGVRVTMDIPLDHYIEVQMGALPPPARTGPDRFRVNAYLDLGGEGLIHRVVNGQDFDELRRRDASRPFRFSPEPALEGSLEDGRYRVVGGWYTTEFDAQPYTVVVQNGVTAVDETVNLPDFLGIPQATSPAYGERIPRDRVLRWEAAGGPAPDVHMILMVGGDGNPAWRMFVRGDVNEAPIPDLSSIPEIDDISSGSITWVVYSMTIEGFDFDTFTYAHLNDRYWSRYALDYFLAQL